MKTIHSKQMFVYFALHISELVVQSLSKSGQREYLKSGSL